MMLQKIYFTALTFAAASSAAVSSASADQPSMATSVSIADVSVEITPASMSQGLTTEQEIAILDEVRGRYPASRFNRDSIVAPFRLEQNSIKNDAGQRVGHRVDLWFIAHGSIATILDKSLMSKLVDANQPSQPDAKTLSESDLRQRGIDPIELTETTVAFYPFTAPIIDRVEVAGVLRTTLVHDDGSVTGSISLDDRFAADRDYPNQWRSLREPDDPPRVYAGLGGYARATELKSVDGGMLIEVHGVMHEPEDWFGGANLLGSKLPLAVQDAVRDFRRALKP